MQEHQRQRRPAAAGSWYLRAALHPPSFPPTPQSKTERAIPGPATVILLGGVQPSGRRRNADAATPGSWTEPPGVPRAIPQTARRTPSERARWRCSAASPRRRVRERKVQRQSIGQVLDRGIPAGRSAGPDATVSLVMCITRYCHFYVYSCVPTTIGFAGPGFRDTMRHQARREGIPSLKGESAGGEENRQMRETGNAGVDMDLAWTRRAHLRNTPKKFQKNRPTETQK